MIAFGNLLKAIGSLLSGVLNIFIFLFIARAIISWFSPDPGNPLVQFLYGSTEPVLRRVRRYVPPIGMIDFSVIIVILLCYFLDTFVADTLRIYGEYYIRNAFAG